LALLLVVDDHPLFRDGFAYMARELRPHWVVRFADSAPMALDLLREIRPDLVIIDVGLPGEDGFTLLKTIAQATPGIVQALISGRDDAAVGVRARSCGARGFIPKTTDPQMMAERIDSLLSGDCAFAAEDRSAAIPKLTARQAEVLLLLTEGHGNKEIRHRLGIAERTVRAHLTDLFELLGAHSRTQAIVRARELGLIA